MNPFWWAAHCKQGGEKTQALSIATVTFTGPLCAQAKSSEIAPLRKAARVAKVEVLIPVATNDRPIDAATPIFLEI